MKQILYRLFEHQHLTKEESREVLIKMAEGKYSESQIAAFISVYLMRSISVEEILGFREALLEMRVNVDSLRAHHPIDIVGTGGDDKNTFNISTAACFVVAGAGYKVVKHGNYGATSISGASNVMEEHGVKFTKDVRHHEHSLDKTNIAYLHAPFFNPALKTVAPVRKSLGVRTFFNILGPIVNPLIPDRQMLGVYDLKMARLYQYIYQQTQCDFSIVHSLDGYDEISLTAPFKVFSREGETLYEPCQIGFSVCKQSDLEGGASTREAAVIFDNVMNNTATEAQKNCVIINAAFAIRTIEPKLSLENCILKATESIDSGKAKETLKKFIEINQV